MSLLRVLENQGSFVFVTVQSINKVSGWREYIGVGSMARDFAKKFYNSKAWKKCREAYKQSVNGLCERCLKNGKYVVGDEVHHKICLTPENINNPDITLSFENLELLCSSCHSIEHNEKYSPVREGFGFDENGDLIEIK